MADTHDIPELITIDQLAERLAITRRHIRRLIYQHRIPYIKVGRLVRFDAREIVSWVDAHRTAAGSTGAPTDTRAERRGTPSRSATTSRVDCRDCP